MEEIIKFLDSRNSTAEEKEQVDMSIIKEINAVKPDCTVYAVDGGCSTVIDGGTWSISKLKTGVVSYVLGKRRYEKVSNFMLGIIKKEKSIEWKITPEFSGFNLVSNSTKMEELPNLARSVVEWLQIKKIAQDSEPGDIILRDGAFSSAEAFEKSIINDAVEFCKSKGVFLIGVCKTSRMSKDNQRPFIGVLNEFTSKTMPDKKWFYQDKDITVVKLHENSELCFRIESSVSENLADILSKVCYYSSDPEFTGYPYPLLKVDKIARVRDFERSNENRKAKMLAKSLGKEFIEYDEKTTIAHNMLDKRAYK